MCSLLSRSFKKKKKEILQKILQAYCFLDEELGSCAMHEAGESLRVKRFTYVGV